MAKLIMLVDDSITIQKVVRITITGYDLELITVDNGAEALSRARKLEPDLFLVDVSLPGMDGYELCRAIKDDAILRHIKVLLLFGQFAGLDQARASEAGADGSIEKPFSTEVFLSKVSEALGLEYTPPGEPTQVESLWKRFKRRFLRL